MPDALLDAGSLWGTFARERRESRGGVAAQEQRLRSLVRRMSAGPIAELPEKANEQHYELPAEFMELLLGPRLKYSGCLWKPGVESLAEAEEAMLAATCARAGVEDGMRVLDLGCGWGSLSLWLAERYPAAEVVAVSNALAQRQHIEARAARAGLGNLTVLTADVNEFEPPGRFDRVVSIEMFEHMRNWSELLRRISTWLQPGGRAFVHVFSHRTLPYRFESTWAAERFFTAGLMPSHDLLLHFQRDLRLLDRWAVPGTHYARTLDAWLENLDARREEALAILERETGSRAEARRLTGTWRLFLLSTRRMWGRSGGGRWMVSQYLLAPSSASRGQREEAGGAAGVAGIAGAPLGDVALE
jgi:cyclopropane-fatty-acyl-phospholipid synthase